MRKLLKKIKRYYEHILDISERESSLVCSERTINLPGRLVLAHAIQIVTSGWNGTDKHVHDYKPCMVIEFAARDVGKQIKVNFFAKVVFVEVSPPYQFNLRMQMPLEDALGEAKSWLCLVGSEDRHGMKVNSINYQA